MTINSRLLATLVFLGTAAAPLRAQSIYDVSGTVSAWFAERSAAQQKKAEQRRAQQAQEAKLMADMSVRLEAIRVQVTQLVARFGSDPQARAVPRQSLLSRSRTVAEVLPGLVSPAVPDTWGYYCGGRKTLSGAWSASCGQGYGGGSDGGPVTRALALSQEKPAEGGQLDQNVAVLRAELTQASETLDRLIKAVDGAKLSAAQDRFRQDSLPNLRSLLASINGASSAAQTVK